MSRPIRIFVADDHPVVRDGLIALLSTQPDFQVVGQASDGEGVIAQIPRLNPDVLLLDLEMPRLDGVQTLERLKELSPEVRTIVFTAYDTDERILSAVRAGARGYLLKDAPREELFKAIRVVGDGGSLLQPMVASRLLQQLSSTGRDRPSREALTDREMDVLLLLAEGKTNREIGSKLHITMRTVKFHVSSILDKLGASNRTEAVTLAVQRGYVDIPDR